MTTPRGRVRAPEIVVAINAAATGWRPVARHVTNFGSYVVLTEPVPELLEQIGWTGGEAIVDGRMFLHYFRTTQRRTRADGQRLGADRFRRASRRALHRRTCRRRRVPSAGCGDCFRGLRTRASSARGEGRSTYRPTTSRSSGRCQASGRVHYGLGYSGHGVGPSWLGGQILASLALGRDDEWTSLPLATRRVPSLPPEPLKRLGGGLVRSAIMACERADEDGRRAPLPARLGAALPRLFRHGDRHAVSFETVDLDDLRRRRSEKWNKFPPDVLPSHIAEMDFAVAPPIEEVLVAAVRAGDLGYAHARSSGLPEAFAAFAERRWGWAPDPADVVAVPDVMVGVAELLRVLTPEGAGVVINPPVYPPFFSIIAETGRRVVEVPLVDGALPLDGMRDALEQRRERRAALQSAEPDRHTCGAPRTCARSASSRPSMTHCSCRTRSMRR